MHDGKASCGVWALNSMWIAPGSADKISKVLGLLLGIVQGKLDPQKSLRRRPTTLITPELHKRVAATAQT